MYDRASNRINVFAARDSYTIILSSLLAVQGGLKYVKYLDTLSIISPVVAINAGEWIYHQLSKADREYSFIYHVCLCQPSQISICMLQINLA